MTSRRALGAEIETPRWWLLSRACPTKKDTKLVISMTANATAANTPSLAHRTGSRLGTAVSEERIIPVLYSPLISSTPSTPIASWENKMPFRLVEIGLKLALSAALKGWYLVAGPAGSSAPTP